MSLIKPLIHGMCLGKYSIRRYCFGWARYRATISKDIPKWLERLRRRKNDS